MGRADKEEFHKIFFFRPHPSEALAAPALGPVETDGVAFDVSFMADGDHHVFFGNEILHIDVARFMKDLGSPLIAVPFPNLLQLVLDDFKNHGLALENGFVPCNALDQVLVLGCNLLPFQPCEPLKSHVEDGLGLDLGERKITHEPGLGFLGIR